MPGDHEQDIVSPLPQLDDIPLWELLRGDTGKRPVLSSVLQRTTALMERPQDAVCAFNNFVRGIEPG